MRRNYTVRYEEFIYERVKELTVEQVKEVSVDRWGGFKKVIKEVFPNALIVIDRFHVMKLVNQALNKLRLFLE